MVHGKRKGAPAAYSMRTEAASVEKDIVKVFQTRSLD